MKRKVAGKAKTTPTARHAAKRPAAKKSTTKRVAAAKTTTKKSTATPRAKRPARKRNQDAVDAMIAASAEALGLTLDPAWRDSIKFNLQLVLRHAALIDAFPLPDDAEPAPVFHA
jgi:hypothetical protein